MSAAGPAKLIERFERHLLQLGEQVRAVVMDNSYVIESGGRVAGTRYRGDKTAQELATARGFDLDERLELYVLTLTDRRLVGWSFRLNEDPRTTFEIAFPGPRLTSSRSLDALLEAFGTAATRVEPS